MIKFGIPGTETPANKRVKVLGISVINITNQAIESCEREKNITILTPSHKGFINLTTASKNIINTLATTTHPQ